MSDLLAERAFAFWNSRAYCENDEHGEKPGGHAYRSECAGCLADLLRSVAEDARREEAEKVAREYQEWASGFLAGPARWVTQDWLELRVKP